MLAFNLVLFFLLFLDFIVENTKIDVVCEKK